MDGQKQSCVGRRRTSRCARATTCMPKNYLVTQSYMRTPSITACKARRSLPLLIYREIKELQPSLSRQRPSRTHDFPTISFLHRSSGTLLLLDEEWERERSRRGRRRRREVEEKGKTTSSSITFDLSSS